MYQRILVPVDGSSAADRGVQEAIRLAGALQARLLFLHVLDDYPMLQEMTTQGSLDTLLRDLRHAGLDVLARARQAAEQASVHCETLMREVAGRRVADVIVEQVGQHHCDLLVIGTHGRRGLARLALGSDADQVVRHSPVPVLLVRKQIDTTAAAPVTAR